jgi:PAS domain S-box-containing protein
VDVLYGVKDRGLGPDARLTFKFAHSHDLLASLPVGVFTCDSRGALVECNAKAVEIWGREPAQGESVMDVLLGPVLHGGEAVRGRETCVLRPDGSSVPVLANIDPLFGDDGALIGAVTCFQEIDSVDTRLKDQERSFRELLDALPAAVYTTDAQGKITFFNRAAASLAGREPKIGEDEWCVTWRLYNPDGSRMAHDQCPMAQALKRNEPVRGAEAIVERPDGSRVWMTPYPTPLRDADGNLTGAVNMLIDISERKRAEVRQKALIDEVNHRVKNTLATVQAFAAQTLRHAVSPEMRESFEARLMALSRVHDQLSRQQWESAELEAVLKDVFAPHRGERGDRIRLGGSPVRLPPRTALSLAMVLHELTSNAARYGALSVPQGVLTVTWRLSETGAKQMLHIAWSEDGGPRAEKPTKQGFGLKLLERGIGKELGGQSHIAFTPDGVRCTIDVPLPVRN